jgi:hypothetical protein
MTTQCDNCKKVYKDRTGFWGLSNYHGVSGNFCGKCYDKVSHNSYGKPEQPGEYLAILLKQGYKHAS